MSVCPLFPARTHTSTFCQETRTSSSENHGRTGTTLDLGTTQTGSSDEYLVLMSEMSGRPLTALGHDVIHRRFSSYLWGERFHSVGCHTRHYSLSNVGNVVHVKFVPVKYSFSPVWTSTRIFPIPYLVQISFDSCELDVGFW
jgi:hypothetical protein